ncbi:uncharacterized protein KGF55_000295 [Candida pseudojiufengensis]|uniref:uncharacterized protein n=1 Tax=Candida pseudojiufengensis TaxID=497109 RepID=UPI0022241FCD|nr:uncharacterized protein KGF55_000295 [Candida pseudojiufengensis]KAI5966886.1 hypothetical protein KGF55_000295 [Candida pseudojiufengensis]
MPNIQRVGKEWDISIEFEYKGLTKYMIPSPEMELNIELILNGQQIFENQNFLKNFASCFFIFFKSMNYDFKLEFNSKKSITFILINKINYQSIPNKNELKRHDLKISLIGKNQINFRNLIKEINELLIIWLSDLDLKSPLIFSKILRDSFLIHLGKNNNYKNEYNYIKDIVNNHKSTTCLYNLVKNPKIMSILIKEYKVSPILNILKLIEK